MKKLWLIAFVITGLIFLSGCADIRTHLTINANGSADLEQRVALPQSIAGMMNGLGRMEEQFKAQGYDVKVFDEGQTVGVVATKHFKQVADVLKEKSTNNINLFRRGADQRPALRMERGFLTTQYQFDSVVDLTSMKSAGADAELANSIVGSMKFKFVMTLPVKPDKHNAVVVSPDGKTLEWQLVPGQTNPVQVSAHQVNLLNISLIVLLIAVLAGMACWFFHKPKTVKQLEATVVEPSDADFGT